MTPDQLRLLEVLRELDIKKSRESFLHYYQRMTGHTPQPHHRAICKLLQAMDADRVDRAMVFLPPRMAKALDVKTKIPTPHGMVEMQDIAVGDEVFHPSGVTTKVSGVSEVFHGHRCFRVKLSDGSEVIADADHLWTTRLCRKRDFWKEKTTLNLFDRFIANPKARSPRLPPQCGASMPEKDLPVPPYTFGLWLGDGHSACSRISAHVDDIPHHVAMIEADGFRVSSVWHNRFTVRGLQVLLKKMGACPVKMIPEQYLFGSEDQRRALLRGLMDSDGTVSESGYCSFCNTNPHLIRAFRQLLWSLGIKNCMNEARATLYGKDCGPSYKVHFLDNDCCALPRKRERLRNVNDDRSRHIMSIVEVESRPTRCISVEASDGLFLAGEGFIPTHNSTLCTQLFPSWLMGRYPNTAIMSGVHTQKYAEKTGKIVRNYLRNQAYPFDTRLAADSQAKSQWATTDGGEYNGFGLMGGSTHGNPAEWLLMDDLIKGRKMAMSPHMRDEAWDTYKADLLTRLQGRKKQLLTTTRWHEDDPSGRILPEDFNGKTGWYADRETGERWFVLCIPARAEHENDPAGRKVGEWLWPEAWGEKAWGPVEKRGGYIWSALYQQRPAPEEGLMFQSGHIQDYNPADLNMADLVIYITSDYAVTAEAGASDPDYTVHSVWGVDSDWNIYLLDMWRGRTLSDKWVEEFIRLVRKWKPLMAGEEQGQIIKGVGPFLVRQMRDESVFVHRKQYTSATSKEQRAQSLLGMASMGKLFIPRGHPMSSLFRAELLAFPGGKHDDMVDTATLFARMLADLISGRKRPGKELSQTESLFDLFSRSEEDDRT